MSNNIAGLKPGTRRVFYAAVVSIRSLYFFIMYDDIADLKPGTKGGILRSSC